MSSSIGRRSFLKASGLGLMGLLLSKGGEAEGTPIIDSPLEQLKQFYPREFIEKFRKYRRGKRIPTICNYCAVGCGMIGVVSEGGELIELEGDPYHPINEGALCSKGAATIQLIRNPRRVLYPMKRSKPKGADDPGWVRISWDEAYQAIVENIMRIWRRDVEPRIRKPDGYYLIGRESPFSWLGSSYHSNEENYLFKKFMSLLGSMNVDHTARICHSTTVAAFASTFGFGAMTNHWTDLINSRRILIIGANPAEQHPVAIKWINRARDRGAKVIHLDPRYNRTSSIADIFANFRPGSEIPIYLGIARYVVFEKPERVDWEFLEKRTNAPYDLEAILADEEVKPEDKLPDWRTNPRSVWSHLVRVIERYTPEEVSRITGIPVEKFRKIAETFTEEKPGTIVYSMGSTQHHNGTQNMRGMAVLQLILGNIGKPGGGINAERGISNVQGSTDMNVMSHILMGYRTTPRNLDDVRRYQKWKNSDPLRRGGVPGGVTYKPRDRVEERWDLRHFPTWNALEYHWGIYIGTWPGKDPDNEPVVCDLPIGKGYTMVPMHKAMKEGKIKFAFYNAANHAGSLAFASEKREGLMNLEFFVVQDLFESEAAHYADILLPGTATVAEKEGSVTNSGRWIQWRWKIVDPPGEAVPEYEVVTKIFRMLRRAGLKLPSEKFEEDNNVEIKRVIGGVEVDNNPDEHWPSTFGDTPKALYKEIGAKQGIIKVGNAVLPQAPANILYRGQWDPELRPDLDGILAMRRDKRPVSSYDAEYYQFKNWAYSWMDNQRILYDLEEDPPGLKTFFNWWATNRKSFLGLDVASLWSRPLYRPGKVENDIKRGVFPAGMEDRHPEYLGFPVHNEPVEYPDPDLVKEYPPIWDDRYPVVKGDVDEYPAVLTTFRLSEHMHVGQHTRNLPWLAELFPELFIEISPEYADELGIKSGDEVIVKTARKPDGIRVKAIVTKRIRSLNINGRKIHIVALPWHWGFKGLVKGPIVNDLTIDAGDSFTEMPETKVCLCRVEPAS